MRKIPTIFKRDFNNGVRLLPEWNPDCLWVRDGEGVATQKYDGTCCLVRDGRLYKRREVKVVKADPPGFELVQTDMETGKRVGWVPVMHGSPGDRWYDEAYSFDGCLPDGTYELIGPKVHGNPECADKHTLIPHANAIQYIISPRTFENIRDTLETLDVEGFVFHHADGRMAKIKKKDFGLKRRKS